MLIFLFTIDLKYDSIVLLSEYKIYVDEKYIRILNMKGFVV